MFAALIFAELIVAILGKIAKISSAKMLQIRSSTKIFSFFLSEKLVPKTVMFSAKKSQKLIPQFLLIMSDSQKLIPQNKTFLRSQSQKLVPQTMSTKINALNKAVENSS